MNEPDTVTIVCSDGRILHTQVSQSILPFSPEIAAIPVPEPALLAGAAAIAAFEMKTSVQLAHDAAGSRNSHLPRRRAARDKPAVLVAPRRTPSAAALFPESLFDFDRVIWSNGEAK